MSGREVAREAAEQRDRRGDRSGGRGAGAAAGQRRQQQRQLGEPASGCVEEVVRRRGVDERGEASRVGANRETSDFRARAAGSSIDVSAAEQQQ